MQRTGEVWRKTWARSSSQNSSQGEGGAGDQNGIFWVRIYTDPAAFDGALSNAIGNAPPEEWGRRA